MTSYCCIIGCRTTIKDVKNGIKLHKFPSHLHEYEKFLRWTYAVKTHRSHVSNDFWEPKYYTRICSKHFVRNVVSNQPASPSYVPTIFPKIKKKLLETPILLEEHYVLNKMQENYCFVSKPLELSKIQNYLQDHNYILKTFCCQKADLEVYSCKHCSFKSDYKVQLKEHLKQCLKPPSKWKLKVGCVKSYVCRICLFKTNSMLHWITHTEKNCATVQQISWLFYCHHCPFTTKSDMDFEHHLKNGHASVCSWLKCDLETFETNMKASFVAHKRLVPLCQNLKGPLWFYCNKCNFRTQSKAVLKIHVERDYHSRLRVKIAKWFECSVCAFKTKRKNELNFHIRSKHYYPRVWFNCDKCDFKTDIQEYLKRHEQLKHLAWDAPCSLF